MKNSNSKSSVLPIVVFCSFLLSFAAASIVGSREASSSNFDFDIHRMLQLSAAFPNSLKQVKNGCAEDTDCPLSSGYCSSGICEDCDYDYDKGGSQHWDGSKCVPDNCKIDETWDKEEKACREFTEGEKIAIGVIIALAVCIPILLIVSICCCCYFCAGCALYACRRRRD